MYMYVYLFIYLFIYFIYLSNYIYIYTYTFEKKIPIHYHKVKKQKCSICSPKFPGTFVHLPHLPLLLQAPQAFVQALALQLHGCVVVQLRHVQILREATLLRHLVLELVLGSWKGWG